MPDSLESFVTQLALRGSWFGGGSAAALTAALAAALLEKVTTTPAVGRRLRRAWRECLTFVEQDARTFAQVIRASRSGDRRAFRRRLKQATEAPCGVAARARMIQVMGRAVQRSVRRQFQSDVFCAISLARAAEASALSLVRTNVTWLKDNRYAARVRRLLRPSRSAPHGRSGRG